MSALNYSKWDKLTLSDDSDTECHPNIDKKSFIKWKREALHKERDERKLHLDAMARNMDLLRINISNLKSNPNSDLNNIFKAIPKLEEELKNVETKDYYLELQRVYDLIQKDYQELKRKEDSDLSVEKVCHEGFSSTRVNIKPKNKKNSSESQFETLNQPGLALVPKSLKSNQLLLKFVSAKSIDDIYNYIQSCPEVVTADNQEVLLSSAFEYAFEYGDKLKQNGIQDFNPEKDELFMEGLKRIVFNSTFIQYSLQADPRMMYQKFKTIPAALEQFELEVANTTRHIISRLAAKMNQPEDGQFFDLSPSSDKSELLKNCPPKMKDIILREDFDAFKEMLDEMGDEESSKWLEKLAKVKLIELVAVDEEGNEIVDNAEPK